MKYQTATITVVIIIAVISILSAVACMFLKVPAHLFPERSSISSRVGELVTEQDDVKLYRVWDAPVGRWVYFTNKGGISK